VPDYIYKDNDTSMPTLSAMLTSRMGDETGNHEAAHLDTINLLVSVFSSGSMLDIGCGMGRITEASAGKIKELVALEPDLVRCEWTRAVVADCEGVTVQNLMTQEYMDQNPGKQFDLVILSMVLQHQSTHNCARLMADVASLTRCGGFAVISSTHALERAKCFTYQHVSQARISEEEFNRYAENHHAQDKGLPVRRFSRAEFEAIVPESFDIIQWTQFSYYRPEFLDRFAEIHRVDAQELASIGNSQFMVLKKKNN
jgi:2-polyprenyl-3-methyl-5-hydroxy-6-metoxy-1,4-benzoquinol methylase